MNILFWIYAAAAVVAAGYFLLNILNYRALTGLAGRKFLQWSSKFNLGIRFNIINWLIVLLYVAATIFFFITRPKANSNVLLVVILMFFLAHSPRWNILIGSDGVLLGLKFFPWKDVIEKKMIERKEGVEMELRFKKENTPTTEESRTIRLPFGKSKDLDVFLKNL